MRQKRFLGVSVAFLRTCITPEDNRLSIRGHFWQKQIIARSFGVFRYTHVIGVYAFKHNLPLSLRNKNTVAFDYQTISYTKLVAKISKFFD